MNHIATGKASILINLYLFHSIPYSNALYIRYFVSIRNKTNMTEKVINLIISHDYIEILFNVRSGSAID